MAEGELWEFRITDKDASARLDRNPVDVPESLRGRMENVKEWCSLFRTIDMEVFITCDDGFRPLRVEINGSARPWGLAVGFLKDWGWPVDGGGCS